MAKFRYRMQNILDIKEKMENQAKTAYGMANAKLAAEQQKLQDILIHIALSHSFFLHFLFIRICCI